MKPVYTVISIETIDGVITRITKLDYSKIYVMGMGVKLPTKSFHPTSTTIDYGTHSTQFVVSVNVDVEEFPSDYSELMSDLANEANEDLAMEAGNYQYA